MTTQESNARVHRFRESVAVNFPSTETVYLSPVLARQLADQLARYADDIDAVDFLRSPLAAVELGGEES